ncbi:hypothetical protein HD806DRAFT_187137 [Xylariaceae sp. AK1471]|nr:hypothetical protein HD806DRAFT_187137 [Xylariaceae sp. AK1471]
MVGFFCSILSWHCAHVAALHCRMLLGGECEGKDMPITGNYGLEELKEKKKGGIMGMLGSSYFLVRVVGLLRSSYCFFYVSVPSDLLAGRQGGGHRLTVSRRHAQYLILLCIRYL